MHLSFAAIQTNKLQAGNRLIQRFTFNENLDEQFFYSVPTSFFVLDDSGWKSPYQSEADAVDQAHRLADGYNRQFLRVLRPLRDLRRYAPVVIQKAQQVNVASQQVNVSG